MITIDQIIRGMSRFADTEIIPHLPTGKGIAAGIALSLVMDGGKQQILALREHPAVKMLGIMDEDGKVDLDRLYSAARPKMEGQKLPVNIPLIGELKFDVNDLDRLYKIIKEA